MTSSNLPTNRAAILPRFWRAALAVTLPTVAAGCSLLNVDINGEVQVDFAISATETDYTKLLVVNPNEHPDVRDNADRIKNGRVTRVNVEITRLGAENKAKQGSATIFARRPGTAWPTDPITSFENMPIVVGQKFDLAMTPAKAEELSKLVFPDEGGAQQIEVDFRGRLDAAPLDSDNRLTMAFDVTAGP